MPTRIIDVNGNELLISSAGVITGSLGASAIPTATTMQSAAGTGNPSGTSLNVSGYATAILSIVSGTPMSGGTTVNFEGSVDDTTWVSLAGHQIGSLGSQAISTTADGDWRFNVAGYKSVRARISAWSAGVTTIKGYTIASTGPSTTVSVSGGNVASGATDSGNPVKVAGVYNSTKPTFTTGQRGDAQLDTRGNLQVALFQPNSATAVSFNALSASGGNNVGDTNLSVRSYPHLYDGSQLQLARTPFKFVPLASTAIGSEATVWTPTTGKKFRLMGFSFSASAAVTIVLKDNTAGTTIWQTPTLVANEPHQPPSFGNGILSAAANNLLTATASGAANLIGTFWGTEE